MSRLEEIQERALLYPYYVEKNRSEGKTSHQVLEEYAEDVPWLIERVEELERENERLEDKLTEWRTLSSDEARRAIDDVVG